MRWCRRCPSFGEQSGAEGCCHTPTQSRAPTLGERSGRASRTWPMAGADCGTTISICCTNGPACRGALLRLLALAYRVASDPCLAAAPCQSSPHAKLRAVLQLAGTPLCRQIVERCTHVLPMLDFISRASPACSLSPASSPPLSDTHDPDFAHSPRASRAIAGPRARHFTGPCAGVRHGIVIVQQSTSPTASVRLVLSTLPLTRFDQHRSLQPQAASSPARF